MLPLFAIPSGKLGRSNFFLFLFKKILPFSIQYIFLAPILLLVHRELNEIKLFVTDPMSKGFSDTHWGEGILQIEIKFERDHFPSL